MAVAGVPRYVRSLREFGRWVDRGPDSEFTRFFSETSAAPGDGVEPSTGYQAEYYATFVRTCESNWQLRQVELVNGGGVVPLTEPIEPIAAPSSLGASDANLADQAS